MKQELRLQQNNEGFSLVELIVTILISSVIMMAVVGLLTTGLNLYKNVSTETLLQIEGQAACGRINELVQEAQYLEIEPGIGENNNKALVLMTMEEDNDPGTNNIWWYYIVWDAEGKTLLLKKQDSKATDIETVVSDMVKAENKKKYLLAQYIDTFDFSRIGTENLYRVNIILATNNKQFSTSQFIDERNK